MSHDWGPNALMGVAFHVIECIQDCKESEVTPNGRPSALYMISPGSVVGLGMSGHRSGHALSKSSAVKRSPNEDLPLAKPRHPGALTAKTDAAVSSCFNQMILKSESSLPAVVFGVANMLLNPLLAKNFAKRSVRIEQCNCTVVAVFGEAVAL